VRGLSSYLKEYSEIAFVRTSEGVRLYLARVFRGAIGWNTRAMEQKIVSPAKSDLRAIAMQLMHASELVSEASGHELTGGKTDLAALQKVIDSKLVEPEATYSLQALGLAFGKVFVSTRSDFDWCMVEDEYGRDPALRYKQTTLLLFPKTMISKRIEDGKAVNVTEMFEGLQETVREVLAEHYPDA
jgi:hypothetical protein